MPDQGGHYGYTKKVAAEARLRAIWAQVGDETFIDALILFADAKSIAAKSNRQSRLKEAWCSVRASLNAVQQAQDAAHLDATWKEIELGFDEDFLSHGLFENDC